MPNESNRNLIIFAVIAMIALSAYQFLVIEPTQKKHVAEQKAKDAAAGVQPGSASGAGPAAAPPPVVLTREQALGPANLRHAIKTPQLAGSLTLKGGRIDDLALVQYEQGLEKGSPPVQLLRPEGSENAWFADFWWDGQNLPGLPTPDTVWTLTSGDTLTPTTPLVMTYASPGGLVFTRRIAVDDKFMFTVTDTVANNGPAPVMILPASRVERQGLPKPAPGQPALGANGIVHEGAIGVFGPKGDDLKLSKYSEWLKKPAQTFDPPAAWVGITDKYWLVATAADPDPSHGAVVPSSGDFNVVPGAVPTYFTHFRSAQWMAVAPGKPLTHSTYFFAGAKLDPMLEAYEHDLKIPNFANAIDWGRWFWFLTRPAFKVLDFIHGAIGNFGLSILALTVLVRLLLFPLANKSYESMTKMKKLQPKLEELKTRIKDDPAKQQEAMMKIYAEEKINPMMGCLPMLVQIPIFYSVYKTLSVTIEMRHAPFFGWIHDLSSQDPTTLWNLFGLIPWHPDAFSILGMNIFAGHLHLGVLPLLYGFTMWLTTAMNPPAPDPMQQRIFQLMPIMFTFIMATFPVGLLIYWTWSNVLSILQQYVIMHRLKVDNPIDKFIANVRGIGHHAEPT